MKLFAHSPVKTDPKGLTIEAEPLPFMQGAWAFYASPDWNQLLGHTVRFQDPSGPSIKGSASLEMKRSEALGYSHAEAFSDPETFLPGLATQEPQEESSPIIFPDDPLYPKRVLAEHPDKKFLPFPDVGLSSEDDVNLVGTPFGVDLIDLVDLR